MEVVPLLVSVIALLSPFIAVWISHRKLRPELTKLSEEVENLRFQNEEARASERKRVRSQADAVDVLPLGFDHWSEESMHHHAELVLQHLPDHPDPLKALVVRVDNKGPYPVRDIVLATTNFRPAVASMNGEDPEVRVRPLPSDLVPIKSKKGALFVFPDIEACAESDKLAVWFTDDEDRSRAQALERCAADSTSISSESISFLHRTKFLLLLED